MSGKNPPVMKSSSSSSRRSTRRSARRGGGEGQQNPVVAPGFGTKKDIEKLTKDLSDSGGELPVEAVEAMMNSRGRGIFSPSKDSNDSNNNSKPGATSSAWADFMKEEGVDLYGTSSSSSNKAAAAASANNSNNNDDNERKKKSVATKKKSGGGKRKSYDLDCLEDSSFNDSSSNKKAKTIGSAGGSLLQSGTLDVTVVGRKGLPKQPPSYQLQVPTRILPGIGITRVFTSCNACHSIALDTKGRAYGWGRNDQGQLTSALPANVAVPTLLLESDDDDDDDDEEESTKTNSPKVVSAACGKSHTLLLTDDGKVMAVGFNKMGQCGLKSSVETIKEFKQCIFPPSVKIAQISCGEHFSVALSTTGQIYTTGSSEYGQLGNGETGEFFVTASKLAFANCNVFTIRNRFMERDPAQETSLSTHTKEKLVAINEDIRIQSIACGKHHTVAVEANYREDDDDDDDNETPPRLRVFSWGCGDYGVLGHGIQADEYFPREIAALGSSIWLPPGPLTASAGAHCSLLKTSNGHVYYWGKHRSVGEATMRPHLVEALANNRHVVSHCAAGGQTVVCATEGAQAVAWGQGPHGELGLGTAKSSAKPQFVDKLTGCRVQDLACGYGSTIFVIMDDDAEDKKAIEKLDLLDENAKDELEAVWASQPSGGEKKAKGKRKSS